MGWSEQVSSARQRGLEIRLASCRSPKAMRSYPRWQSEGAVRMILGVEVLADFKRFAKQRNGAVEIAILEV